MRLEVFCTGGIAKDLGGDGTAICVGGGIKVGAPIGTDAGVAFFDKFTIEGS